MRIQRFVANVLASIFAFVVALSFFVVPHDSLMSISWKRLIVITLLTVFYMWLWKKE